MLPRTELPENPAVSAADNHTSVFETLHRDFHAMVFQLCRGYMKGDYAQASDLTQEVFINVWNALARFNGTSTYKTWIYRITVNTCLKFLRDRKDTNHFDIAALEEEVPDEATPEIQDELEAANRSLYQALGRLHEVDRLLMMMVLDELDYEEIAEVTGISAGNLRVKIHRIRDKLKHLIEL